MINTQEPSGKPGQAPPARNVTSVLTYAAEVVAGWRRCASNLEVMCGRSAMNKGTDEFIHTFVGKGGWAEHCP